MIVGASVEKSLGETREEEVEVERWRLVKRIEEEARGKCLCL